MRYSSYFILAFLLFSNLSGQEIPEAERNIGFLQTGLSYQMWKVEPDPDPINQFSIPTYYSYPLNNNVSINISQTPAFSWWRDDRKIVSASDTWLQTNILLAENFMMNLGFSLPTGKTQLDTNQYILTQAILSNNIYQYRLRQHGQGFSAKAGAAYSFTINESIFLGVGAQYIYRSKYNPLEYSYEFGGKDGKMKTGTVNNVFKPGDEVSAQLGVDFLVNRNLGISIDGTYSYYFKDYLDDYAVFNSGSKLLALINVHYKYSYGKYMNGTLLFRSKTRNELLQQSHLQNPGYNYNGAQIEFKYALKFFESGDNGILFLFDARYHKNKFDAVLRNDLLVGMGVGALYGITNKLAFDFNAKYMFGQFGDRSAIGIETYVGIQLNF